MTRTISGRTRIIPHLGVPTESFKAPMIYNPWFEDRGIDAVVVPMGCEAADFAAFLPLLFRLRNIAGAIVTMPHKVSAVALLDRASPTVAACGSCNAVRLAADGGLEGEMFDGEGFVLGMKRRGRRISGTSALVIGAGGVGSAIAASLARAGASRLGIHDLDGIRASALVERIRRHFPAVAAGDAGNDPAGWDIVVNGTPLGMAPGDPLPVDVDRIEPGAFVGEVVLSAEETPFVAAARARGIEAQVGLDMLFEQIPAYLEFFGFPPASPDDLKRLAHIPRSSLTGSIQPSQQKPSAS